MDYPFEIWHKISKSKEPLNKLIKQYNEAKDEEAKNKLQEQMEGIMFPLWDEMIRFDMEKRFEKFASIDNFNENLLFKVEDYKTYKRERNNEN
jgi:hypothetical protein